MIAFRPEFDCWWPEYDKWPMQTHRRVHARLKDATIAARYCRQHAVVVQAGGHVGFWPLSLAKQFGQVFTFEPDRACFECLVRNTAAFPNITASPRALGPARGFVQIGPQGDSSGGFTISDHGAFHVEQISIDELDLPVCDALVLDVEAYEVPVLQGALRTIERFSPVIHVEELPRVREAIHELMTALDYREVFKVHGDRIYKRGK